MLMKIGDKIVNMDKVQLTRISSDIVTFDFVDCSYSVTSKKYGEEPADIHISKEKFKKLLNALECMIEDDFIF